MCIRHAQLVVSNTLPAACEYAKGIALDSCALGRLLPSVPMYWMDKADCVDL